MGKWVMVFVLAAACGERNGGNGARQSDAGLDDGGGAGNVGVARHDAGMPPDADTTRVELAGGTGSVGGNAGDWNLMGGAGAKGAADGGAGATASGGSSTPSGGAGEAQGGSGEMLPTGGSTAPADHVLWSQSWTVAIHEAATSPGYDNATMGLFLDAGDLCKFGLMGAPSGSTQTFDTDGACITEAANVASGVAVIFDANGQNAHGDGGRAPIAGWSVAIAGHVVKYIRRRQTYSIQLLGAGDTSWNYADFQGTWEAVGQ